MLLSWLRPAPKAPHNRRPARRPASFRPALESLSERICPASPHFLSASASISSTGQLLVSWKEAGLGDNQSITYSVTVTEQGQFQWFNHGGNKPQGTPFQFGPTTDTLSLGTFTSGKNGSITQSNVPVPGTPPPPSADVLAAGSGKNWTLELTITYSNITLTDTTNGVSTSTTPSSVSGGPFVVST
jgi:hypothetical protein